jgi:MerR family transcriptional regulator, redox-sensitive transcriptional activator SoxR
VADSDLMLIGEVAARSGFAASALRYYEREGLITSQRSPGGQRQFHRSVLRRLAFVRAAQSVGLSLEEVRDALATLPDSRTPTRADWARLSRSWRARLDEQIAALEALRDGLTSCIGCGCLSLRRCALYNPGDRMAERGPGARLLPAALRAGQPGGGLRRGQPESEDRAAPRQGSDRRLSATEQTAPR